MTAGRAAIAVVLLVACSHDRGGPVGARWQALGLPLDADHAYVDPRTPPSEAALTVQYADYANVGTTFAAYQAALTEHGYTMSGFSGGRDGQRWEATFAKDNHRAQLVAHVMPAGGVEVSLQDAGPPPAQVTPTGVLDFEIAATDNAFTVRNPSYQITFAARPTVRAGSAKAPDGTTLTQAVAVAQAGGELAGMLIMPIPDGGAFDVAHGLTSMRDGFDKQLGATLVSDDEVIFAGLAGHHSIAKVADRTVEQYAAFDPKHRAVIDLTRMYSGIGPVFGELFGSFAVR